MPALDSTTPITPELIAAHGITREEYQHIRDILGRDPNITELGMFSVMWSEHCSYKNSKPILKLFSKMNAELPHQEHLLVKPGTENAGIVDIGDGLAVWGHDARGGLVLHRGTFEATGTVRWFAHAAPTAAVRGVLSDDLCRQRSPCGR